VFLIFAVGFQIGFANITAQSGQDPGSVFPSGTLPLSFFVIIGDNNDSAMENAPLGTALLGIYSMIAQIMLVNLLIAMMGSTYSKVSDNSMMEWKFYRLEMVTENQMASFQPPPINLIIIPVVFLVKQVKNFQKSMKYDGPNIENYTFSASKAQILLDDSSSSGTGTGGTTVDGEKGKHSQHTVRAALVRTPPAPGENKENSQTKLKLLQKMWIARDEVISKEKEHLQEQEM